MCDFLKDRHHKLIVIDGDIGFFEHGRHLELTGRDFVVPRNNRNAEFVEFVLHLSDASENALRNAAEVVIFELLPARRWRSNQRATGHDEIWTEREMLTINQEILLLGAERRNDAKGALVADELQKFHRLPGEYFARAEERRHFIERFSVIPDEYGRNAQCLGAGRFHNEHR